MGDSRDRLFQAIRTKTCHFVNLLVSDRFQVFNRSKTQEEYVKLVATLIMKLRDYKAKVCHQSYNKNIITRSKVQSSLFSFEPAFCTEIAFDIRLVFFHWVPLRCGLIYGTHAEECNFRLVLKIVPRQMQSSGVEIISIV